MKKRNQNYPDHSKHTHSYCTLTAMEDGHHHGMSGYVTAEADTPCHVHLYEGITTCNDGHTHRFYKHTGPAINIPGGHIHMISGETSKDNGHRHCYQSPTSGTIFC